MCDAFLRALRVLSVRYPFSISSEGLPPQSSHISFNKGKKSFHSEVNKCCIPLHLIGIFAELKIPIEKAANNKSKWKRKQISLDLDSFAEFSFWKRITVFVSVARLPTMSRKPWGQYARIQLHCEPPVNFNLIVRFEALHISCKFYDLGALFLPCHPFSISKFLCWLRELKGKPAANSSL